MAGNEFEVSTASLRSTAGALGDHADTAGQIGAKARSADVDTKSWGLLGLGLGLYTGYSSARDSADRSIAEVSSFLSHAETAVNSCARDYDQADQAGSQIFDSIATGMGGGS